MISTAASAPSARPEPGQIVHVRQRRYLVDGVTEPPAPHEATLVKLSCIDDDAQGQRLSVLWEHELDARVLQDDDWAAAVAEKGFDDPALFAAYLRTLSWNCVTATDPGLFQAPFRAGIKIDAYQLEPLRKALRLPRVNLFIADDVGLGKTIEAGLIARELLLRRRIDKIVVACPPTMLEQWRDEMAARFGLSFVILDRAFVTRMRRERGFSVNPWTTHARFLVSHRLLIDEAYTAGLRDWLDAFAPQSLLILDEAHNVAPSSGARYAIDSQITRAIRDLAPRFEHRLFLSATPHNGHSNSFAALLEIMDPQRFCRGVKVLKGQLDDVMVRRLKADIRRYAGGFPERKVEQIDIDGLPADAPELVLAAKLDAYRRAREPRLAGEPPSRQAAAALVIGGLQKRLLSSIEAFARTLAVHRRSVVTALAAAAPADRVDPPLVEDLRQLTLGADHETAVTAGEDEAEADGREEAADGGPVGQAGSGRGAGGRAVAGGGAAAEGRAAAGADPSSDPDDAERMAKATSTTTDASTAARRAALERELALVDEMRGIAEAGRYEADARIRKIVEWMDTNMCPGLFGAADGSGPGSDSGSDSRSGPGSAQDRPAGPGAGQAGGPPADRPAGRRGAARGAAWTGRRVIIFTEYEDTRRWLERCLRAAIAHTDRADERIDTFTGTTPPWRREEIKHVFNNPPEEHPLRILIATDAAREGLNLQLSCHDLFHLDLPWNPGRIDQRNGRIDRKLQRADKVWCRYFVFRQRPEDRVLEVLVEKAGRIREELGSVAAVLEGRIAEGIGRQGIRRDAVETLRADIRGVDDADRLTGADRLDAGADLTPAAGLDTGRRSTHAAAEGPSAARRVTPAADAAGLNAAALKQAALEELEDADARVRQDRLQQSLDDLRDCLHRSEKRIGLTPDHLRRTLSMGLRLAGAPPIEEVAPGQARPADTPRTFTLPTPGDGRGGGGALAHDPGWAAALDTLRARRQRRERLADWRKRAAIRPVAFEDTGQLGEQVVHLHLEQRVVRRLLSRFTAQGLVHHDLSKTCLTATDDAIPRVILLGRMALYGPRAARLHEEIVLVAARWIDPGRRRGPLAPYGRDGVRTTQQSLQAALDQAGRTTISETVRRRLAASVRDDIDSLLPHLEQRAEELRVRAQQRLGERAAIESRSMRDLLERQQRRIAAAAKADDTQLQLEFGELNLAERLQREADRRAWARRLDAIRRELATEPARVADHYTVRTARIEPIGLVWLWPTRG